MYPYNDFSGALMHYGIPRRSGRYPYGSGEDPYQSITRGRLSSGQKKRLIKKAKKQQEQAKQEAVEQNKPRQKTISEMSDDEIRQSISRLQLEKQYSDLVRSLNPESKQESKPSPQQQKGKKFISDILYNSGKAAATTVLTATFTYAGATAINKMFGKNIVKTVADDKKKKD